MPSSYWNPEIGYIRKGTQFTLNGVTYPKNWLNLADESEILTAGLTPCPDYDAATQVLEQDPTVGWTVRPKTQEELDADAAALAAAQAEATKQAIDRLWKESWDTWGEAQLAAVDRQTINMWATTGKLSATGQAMVSDLVTWHDTVFATSYAAAKAAIESAKGWVEPDWDTWPACPHTFHDFVAERI